MNRLKLHIRDIVKFTYTNSKGQKKERLVEVKTVEESYVNGWDYSVRPKGGHRNFELKKINNLKVLAKHNEVVIDIRDLQSLFWLGERRVVNGPEVTEMYNNRGYKARWEPELDAVVVSEKPRYDSEFSGLVELVESLLGV